MHSNLPRLVLAYILVAVGCAAPEPVTETAHARAASGVPTTAASDVYIAQGRMIRAMMQMFPSVHVDVRWVPCGEENSYYFPDEQLIKLCTEMSAHPGTAVFFAAHEFGHAVTTQLIDISDEQAADEVGALAMLELGLRDEVVEAALYHASQTYQGHYPGDEHPSNHYRAWELLCLEDGSEEVPASAECASFYASIKLRWTMRLFDRVEVIE